MGGPHVRAALGAARDRRERLRPVPLRVQAGAAWTSGRFTAAADLMYLAHREVHDDAGDPRGLDRRVVRNAVANGSAGVEYLVADRFPVRAGAFTDFSSANVPIGTLAGGASPDASNTTHVDR